MSAMSAMTPYRLTLSLRSPFARRIRLALRRLDVRFEEDVVNVFDPPAWLAERSPLALLPILTTPDGKHLPDSGAILEFLHETHGGGIWPSEAALRFDVRRGAELGAGIMTATVAWFLETERKPGERSQAWLDEHRETIERTLAHCRDVGVSGAPWIVGGALTQAGWDLAVALEYLDLRMPQIAWRGLDPGFERLLGLARQAREFTETAPPAPAG